MKLVANWRAVLKHAASVKLLILALVFIAIDVALPYLFGWLPISDRLFALLAALASIAGIFARVVVQKALAPPTEPHWENGEEE